MDMELRTSANHQKHKIKNEFHHKEVYPQTLWCYPHISLSKCPPVGHLGFFQEPRCLEFWDWPRYEISSCFQTNHNHSEWCIRPNMSKRPKNVTFSTISRPFWIFSPKIFFYIGGMIWVKLHPSFINVAITLFAVAGCTHGRTDGA
jgi:hypothetical protein